jgi:hypothetical protein
MNRFLKYFWLMIFLFMSTGQAQAALTAQGNYIFDDIQNQYWVRDLSSFQNKTWDQQVNTLSTLPGEIAGNLLGDWRIAGSGDLNALLYSPEQVYYLFQGDYLLQGAQLGTYLAGRIDVTGWRGNQMIFTVAERFGHPEDYLFSYLGDGLFTKYGVQSWPKSFPSPDLSAWVLADVVTTPIPSALYLLGSALPFIAFFRRKKSR